MNEIIKAGLNGELLPPGDQVRAVGLAHPLKGKRLDIRIPAGLSITEVLQQALASVPGAVLTPHFSVHLDGTPVPAEWWSRIRLKPGTTLTFRPTLHGENPLKTFLSVVIAVAALVVAGPLAGFLGLTGIGLTIGTALISVGIVFAGTMALNALFPTRPAQLSDTSSTSTSLTSIQGANNQANPFGPIPSILGRHLLAPYYGAKSYTEIIGDDQFLRLLFVHGYGPLDLSEHKIGQTALDTFTDCEVEHRRGLPDDAPISLFPAQVDEQGLAVDLKSVDGWQVRTTALDTDEISVDVTAGNGIFQINSQTGNADPYSVTVEAQYSVADAADWVAMPSLLFSRSTGPQRQGSRSVPAARGQFDVRMRKLTADANNDKIKDDVSWTALRSFKNTPPVAFGKPLAMTAMRIKATGQLSGVVDTYNLITASMVKAFDGLEWHENTVSRIPADLYRHVLQGPANARPRTDAQVDIENLQDWWRFCKLNGFTFDQPRTTVSSVYDCLADIAAAGRAVPSFNNGKWGVVWDRPDDTIVQHFTPRNSWGFSGTRTYTTLPHAWRVKFINGENGFTQDERMVYFDGFDKSNATLFEGQEFPGVTDPGLIWKFGRYQAAQVTLRPEDVTLIVGWENIVCTRGDRVRVTHDVLLIGQVVGRVKSVDGQDVTFDELVTCEAGKTYGFQFRVPEDVRTVDRAVDQGENPEAFSGQFTTLTVIGDLSLIVPGTLFAFGETERESSNYRIKGIAHQKDLNATLTLVDDAPAIAQADKGPIPPYNPNVSIPIDPYTLAPQDFRFLEATDGQDNSVRSIIRLSWRAARRGKIVSSQLQIASGDADWKPLAVLPYPQFSLDVPLEAPGIWSYRVRFLFDDNTFSKWVPLLHLNLLGLSAPPPDVQNIRGAAYVDDTTSIAWDEVADYRPIRYAVRKGDSWDAGLELGTIAHPPFAAHGNGTYLVKAYCGPDFSRTYSVNAVQIEIVGSSLVRNVLAVRDEAADGWNGIFTGTVAKSGVLIRTGGSADILSSDDFLGETDVLNKGGQGDGTYEIHPSRYVDARRAVACRVTITWKGTGQIATDDMLSNPDILNNPDFLAAGSTGLVEVYPQISVAQNDLIGDVFKLHPDVNPGNDIFAEPDVFSSDISFGPWIKYEPGLYVGRHFRGRMVLRTSDPQVVAIALGFTFSVDVPDRLDTWALIDGIGTSLSGITVPAAGLSIVFASNAMTIPEPFNGGPNTDAVPAIQITNTSAQAFDFEVIDLTKNGCTIVPRLDGTPTDAPKTNISIQGW